MALGLPAMVLSAPAGAWSDRVDRRHLFLASTAATTVALLAFTLVIASGRATVALAAVAAVVIGAITTVNMPNLQAIVPLLVPPERLMNAAALQNGASQAATFAGLALGGLAIQLLGDWGGFGLTVVASAATLALMARVHVPSAGGDADGATGAARHHEPVLRSMMAGARFGFGQDPLRTLLILAVLLGGSFSVVQVSMPRVVEEVYGSGSAAAGVVLGSFGVGMLVSSVPGGGAALDAPWAQRGPLHRGRSGDGAGPGQPGPQPVGGDRGDGGLWRQRRGGHGPAIAP